MIKLLSVLISLQSSVALCASPQQHNNTVTITTQIITYLTAVLPSQTQSLAKPTKNLPQAIQPTYIKDTLYPHRNFKNNAGMRYPIHQPSRRR